jgi:hypothetical protein
MGSVRSWWWIVRDVYYDYFAGYLADGEYGASGGCT